MNGTTCNRGLPPSGVMPSAIAELIAKGFEPTKRNTFSYPAQSVKVKVQVMQRVKGGRVDLPSLKQMTEIRARTGAARVATAVGVRRAIVLRVPRVLDVDASFAGEELAVSRVAGRQHAVEEVDTSGNRFHQIVWSSRSHEISRA